MTPVQWGRAYRGRLWHLLRDDGPTLCRDVENCVEWQPERPPLGGRVCPKCAGIVNDLHKLVALAVYDERQQWNGGTLVDAEIVDEGPTDEQVAQVALGMEVTGWGGKPL